MADHTLTIADTLGLGDDVAAEGQTIHSRALDDLLGIRDLRLSRAIKRLAVQSDGIGFADNVWAYEEFERTALGTLLASITEPRIPFNVKSGQTRGYVAVGSAVRLFPRINPVTKALEGDNHLGWLAHEIVPAVGCIVRIDPREPNFLNATVSLRWDGYDAVEDPHKAALYASSEEALVTDAYSPGWLELTAYNPIFVTRPNLSRLRAVTLGGSVSIAVEMLLPQGDLFKA